MIKVSGLTKKYRHATQAALQGIDFEIGAGCFFGLLGPNSAGKTTLISILSGILKPDAGSVTIRGVDALRNAKALRAHTGLVPQEIALFPTLTLRENLDFFGSMHGLKGSTLRGRVDECIQTLKLEAHAGKRVSRCSGGIRRRANILAGLIHRPEIIFLDEPTLGVDAQSMNLIYEYLEQLGRDGATIIYTTHYIKEAERLCSRVMIIDDGKIIADGAPDQLIAKHSGCTDLGQVFISLTGKEMRD